MEAPAVYWGFVQALFSASFPSSPALPSFDRNQPPLLRPTPPSPTPPHEKGHKISPRGSCPTTQRWRSGEKSFPHVRRGGSRRRRRGRIPAFCYRSSHSLPRRHRRDLISSSPGNLPPSSLPSSFFNFDVQTKNFQAVDRDGYQLKQSE